MIYLDANVFIFSVLNDGEKGERARSIIYDISTGKESGVTSTLTIDEVVWILWKQIGREAAIKKTMEIFETQNIGIISITPEISFKSLLLMLKYTHLKPRDSIHASACLSSGVFTIASDDPDFDSIKELTRIKL